MDSFSLFAACAIVAFVAAVAFFMAGRARDERFWTSWAAANVVIGAALVSFMYERSLPDLFIVTLPNGLLVFGLTLRWRAAKQFANRRVTATELWAPTAVFVVLCAWPSVYGSYGAVYTIVNVLLTCLAPYRADLVLIADQPVDRGKLLIVGRQSPTTVMDSVPQQR